MRDREHFRQPAQLPKGWQGCAFVLLWGIGFGSAVLMAPLGIGLIFGLIGWGAALGVIVGGIKTIGRQRRGFLVGPEGLVIQHQLWPDRRLGWDQIESVRTLGGGATIHLTDGSSVAFGDEVLGWRRLARRIQECVGIAPPAERPVTGLVAADEIAGWLGIAPDGTLRCRQRRQVAAGLALLPAWIVVTLLLIGFYGMMLGGVIGEETGPKLGPLLFILAHGSIFFGVFSGGLGVKVWRSLTGGLLHGIEADVHGLRVTERGGRRFIDWDELESIRLDDGRWQVQTIDDAFGFAPTDEHSAALVRAIQAALAARQRGLALPSSGEVSAAALSRARLSGEPEADERGLSIAEEGDSA